MSYISECIDFINECPTAYHTIYKLSEILKNNNFIQCNNYSINDLNKRYYFIKNSSIIAVELPELKPNGFIIASSHCDSPMFKLKNNSVQITEAGIVLNVEKYGGMILSTWLDRPLSIAGRILYKENNVIKNILVSMENNYAVIPNTCIHFNRDLNNGFVYNPKIDLRPLIASSLTNNSILSLFNNLPFKENDFLSYDLFLINNMKGFVWGNENEYFSSPRIDDLECVFATLQGFLKSENSNSIKVFSVFDNEETGSLSSQGADSTFLYDVLRSISQYYSNEYTFYLNLLNNSFMISADNGHAVHPNHPELSDSLNRVYMNKGVIVKENSSLKYTTDAISKSIFNDICNKNNIPVQYFSNRSDIAGGSTLGNISNSHVSVKSIDIGAAQLSMHSSFETAGSLDLVYLSDAVKHTYSSSINCDGNDIIIF